MKKIISALFLTLGILCLTACKIQSEVELNPNEKLYTVNDEWKQNSIIELTDKLNVLINDTEYKKTIAVDRVNDMIASAKEAKIDKSKSIGVYTLDEDVIKRYLRDSDVSYDKFSDAAKDVIDSRKVSMISNVVASMFGADSMVMYSLYQVYITYAVDKAYDNQLWVIPTDKENVFIYTTVSFTDKIYPLCTMSCGYIINNDSDISETIDNTMERMGLKASELEFN